MDGFSASATRARQFLPGTGRGTIRRMVEGLARNLRARQDKPPLHGNFVNFRPPGSALGRGRRRKRMATVNFVNFTPPAGRPRGANGNRKLRQLYRSERAT